MKNCIVTYGPVSVAVAAGNSWDSYQAGQVLNDGPNPNGINHAVMVVGWKTAADGKTTIWLGNEEPTAGGYGFDIHSEDDMIAIEGSSGDERFEVFILPDLFPAIRRVMDGLEGRKRK